MSNTIIHRPSKNGSYCNGTVRPHPYGVHTGIRVHYEMLHYKYTPTQIVRLHCLISGGKGIRTPGAVNPAVFKTAAIDHSAIPPCISLPQDLSKMEASCNKTLTKSDYFWFELLTTLL